VVALRMGTGQRDQVVAVAESDLERAGRVAPEQCREIQRPGLKLHAVDRPQLLQRALLRFGNASRTGDEGTNRARMLGFGHEAVEEVVVRSKSRRTGRRVAVRSKSRLVRREDVHGLPCGSALA